MNSNDGPTRADLDAIEREWPQIQADMEELDAEIRLLLTGDHGTSSLDWRRQRRAEARVTRQAVRVTATHKRVA